MEKRCKKGQVTIFIIVAIVIIAAIILFVVFRTGLIPNSNTGKEVNPNAFLKDCLEKKVEETTQTIALQGGNIEPKLYKNFSFTGESERKISYLCYTNKNYLPCITQEPMLIQHLKKEIYENISDDTQEVSVNNCWDEMVSSFEKDNYVVDAKYNDFEVELAPKKVIIKIDGKIILTKNDETSSYEDFDVNLASKFYDLAVVVHEIISQEAKYCYFDTTGFMLTYPDFRIDKLNTGDLSTIYSVEDRDSREKFRFAVRSCVVPPGI